MIHKDDTRTSERPLVIHFEGIGVCFYELLGVRSPQASEFYLSGAIVEAYKAPANLTGRYMIVRPTFHAHRVSAWEVGAAI